MIKARFFMDEVQRIVNQYLPPDAQELRMALYQVADRDAVCLRIYFAENTYTSIEIANGPNWFTPEVERRVADFGMNVTKEYKKALIKQLLNG